MKITKKLKRSISPIRYIGGKSPHLRKIIPYFPERLESMVSPFIGGGSIEVVCSNEGVRVMAYDAFDPVVNFWVETLRNAKGLAETVQNEFWPLEDQRFYQLQDECPSILDPHQQAAVYYTINRSSYSGLGLSGGCPREKERFTEHFINFLRNFRCPNLSVEQGDFHNALPFHDENDFLYADPPYTKPKRGLYGRCGDLHNNFDHQGLADILKSRNNWVLSYDNTPRVHGLYEGHLCAHFKVTYCANKPKKSDELLIFSPDLNDWATEVAAERGNQVEVLC